MLGAGGPGNPESYIACPLGFLFVSLERLWLPLARLWGPFGSLWGASGFLWLCFGTPLVILGVPWGIFLICRKSDITFRAGGPYLRNLRTTYEATFLLLSKMVDFGLARAGPEAVSSGWAGAEKSGRGQKGAARIHFDLFGADTASLRPREYLRIPFLAVRNRIKHFFKNRFLTWGG